MNSVSPYLQSMSNLLLKNINSQRASTGQFDQILGPKLARIERKQDILERQMGRIEQRLVDMQQSLRHKLVQTETIPNSSSESHTNSGTGTCRCNRPTDVGYSRSDDIPKLCEQLSPKEIANLIPPVDVCSLSNEQLSLIQQESTSMVNFAVHLFRLSSIPANRIYMSCSGLSKGPFKQKKQKIHPNLIKSIVTLTRSQFGKEIKDCEVRNSIDSDCRVLLAKARKCFESGGCPACRGESSTDSVCAANLTSSLQRVCNRTPVDGHVSSPADFRLNSEAAGFTLFRSPTSFSSTSLQTNQLNSENSPPSSSTSVHNRRLSTDTLHLRESLSLSPLHGIDNYTFND